MKEAWNRWKGTFIDTALMLLLVYAIYGSFAVFCWLIGAA